MSQTAPSKDSWGCGLFKTLPTDRVKPDKTKPAGTSPFRKRIYAQATNKAGGDFNTDLTSLKAGANRGSIQIYESRIADIFIRSFSSTG